MLHSSWMTSLMNRALHDLKSGLQFWRIPLPNGVRFEGHSENWELQGGEEGA